MTEPTRHEAAIEAAARTLGGDLMPFEGPFREGLLEDAQRAIAAYDAARGGALEDRHNQLDAAKAEVSRRAPRGVVFSDAQAEWIALGALAASRAALGAHEHELSICKDSGTGKPIAYCNECRRVIGTLTADAAARAALSQHPEPRQAEGERHELEDFVRGWGEGWQCACLKADGSLPPQSQVREALTFAGFSDELIDAALSEDPEPRQDLADVFGRAMDKGIGLQRSDRERQDDESEPRQDQPVDRASGETDGPSTYISRAACTKCGSHECDQLTDRCVKCDEGDDAGELAAELGLSVEHPETGEREAAMCDCGHDADRHGNVRADGSRGFDGQTTPCGECSCIDFQAPEPLRDGGELREQVARAIACEMDEEFDGLEMGKEEMLRAADAAIALARPARPVQDGGEREAMKASFHADGRPISGFAAYEAGWNAHARHPHQDVERQEAIDRAVGVMRDSEYVGGPTQRDAWREAFSVLAPLATEHKAANPDTAALTPNEEAAPSPDARGGG